MNGDLDLSRLSLSLSRPGIDPRVTSSLGFALADSVVDLAHGVFVDVQITPTLQEVTCRVGAEYAGDGFGVYRKIKKDDEVFVIFPNGEPGEGGIVIRALWSQADKPSAQFSAHPDDFVVVVENDKDLRIITQGTGRVIVESSDVRLGSEAASEPVPLGNVLVEAFQKLVSESGTDGILSLLNGCFVTSNGPAFLTPQATANILAWGVKYLTSPTTNILSFKVKSER
jgi:hypothetical protein